MKIHENILSVSAIVLSTISLNIMAENNTNNNSFFISEYDSTKSYKTATTCPKGQEDGLIDIRIVKAATVLLADEFQRYHDLHQCVKFYIAHPESGAYSDEGWWFQSESFKTLEAAVNTYVSGGDFVREKAFVRIEANKSEDGLISFGIGEKTLLDHISDLRKELVEADDNVTELAKVRSEIQAVREEIAELTN